MVNSRSRIVAQLVQGTCVLGSFTSMITMKNACGMSQITTTFHRVQIFQRNLKDVRLDAFYQRFCLPYSVF